MEIKEARFLMSNSKVEQCPAPMLPEFAFIGRSNVGKSSLINMLTMRKSLAKVSGTPGKTQLVNHFLVDESWYLVDLPGYGYAKVAKTVKSTFGKIITDYVEQRTNLECLFVLIDIRHEPQKGDLEFFRYLGEHGIPFTIIFTKADKLKPGAIANHVKQYGDEMLKEWSELPDMLVSSSLSRAGRSEIIDYIGGIIQQVSSR
jgi:GTP-binding protein